MDKQTGVHRYGFSTPGRYRILVQGLLSQNWSDRFGAMDVLTRSAEVSSDMTVLQGYVSDQAELSGILNTLYELHLPLLSVQYLDSDSSPPDAIEY